MKLWRYGRPIEYLDQRYRLDGMLGSGGMAEVCLAWDEQKQREVAVKILKSDDLDQETLNRFMKEAGQIVDWQHPHILRIYENMRIEVIDPVQGSVLFYIVMEYARGGDLHKRLTPGKPFPLSASFALFRQLCDAVEYAHQHGVIHRDLKPLNILFRRPATGPEEVVLSDFGLAVQVDASHHTFARGGTLAYMAPEQFQGHAQPASDIFALGVILYQLCSGRLPFRRSIQDLARGEGTPTPTRPSLFNPDLPQELDKPIMRALQELPTERYRSAREFWDTVALALTTSARTFPFLTEDLWSPAGATWPFGGSEQPQENGQASQQTPFAASGPFQFDLVTPLEEEPDSTPGSLREKQKASPSSSFGLSLPTYSIPARPNTAPYPANEQVASHPRYTQETPITRRRFEQQTGRSQRGEASEPAIIAFPPESTRGQLAHRTSNTRSNPPRRDTGSHAGATRPSTLVNSATHQATSSRHASTTGTTSVQQNSQTRLSAYFAEQRDNADSPHTLKSGVRARPYARLLAWSSGPPLSRRLPAIATTLCLLVLVGAIFLAAGAQGTLLHLFGVPNTTVTLTPQTRAEQDTYALTAVTGTPSSANREIQARLLTSTSPTQSTTANATGSIRAKRATGQLTFINNGSAPITINSATISGNSGIQVSFQGPITVPAINPSFIVVTGFAVNPGNNGNIPQFDIVKSCCANGIVVKNTTAFSGGQDAQPNSVIQQKDIDGAADGLVGTLTQGARDALDKQVGSGERVVDGTEQCQPTIQANRRVGDLAKNVTVQVAVTCHAEVYDYATLRQLAGTLLNARAASDPNLGPAYSQSGQAAISVLSANTNATTNEVALSVQARGVWTYTFTPARLHQLASLIAGKNQTEARTLLLQQTGIADTHFSSNGILPGNVDEIRVVVKASQTG